MRAPIRFLLCALPLLTLTACPPPETGGVADPAGVSDLWFDPRADLPGMGGHDPGAGLPEVGEGACRRTVSRPADSELLEVYETTHADGLRASIARLYDGNPVWSETWRYDGRGRVARIEGRSGRSDSVITFSYGRLDAPLEALREDSVGTERWAYRHDAEGGLVEQQHGFRDGDEPDRRATYVRDEAGRLVEKRLQRGSSPPLVVEYTYDAEGRLALKTYDDQAAHADPVEELYAWEGDRLVRVSRPAGARAVHYAHDEAGRVVTVERTAQRDGRTVVVEKTTFDYDCGGAGHTAD